VTDTPASWGGWAPAVREDPAGHFAQARARCPVQRVRLADGHLAWVVLGYDAARQALGDPRISKDMLAALAADGEVVAEGLPGPSFSRHMLNVDPPDHTRLRRLVSRAFVPGRIAALEPAIRALASGLLAACGDVNRNVTCAAHPLQSELHAQVHAYAARISDLLLPKTRAYYEVWLEGEKITDKKEEEDPLYQDRYLPRKFKVGIAIPPNNEVDVLTNDLGLIAIIENNELKGFNIAIGGGLGATHGNADTYPRLATVIGFVSGDEQLFSTIYEIVTIQRDYGNRSDRKLARLKYTLDKYGVDWYKQELAKRTGFELEAARPYAFTDRKDYYGWQENHQGLWYYTPFIESGRVLDDEKVAIKSALFEIAETGKAHFRFTANQSLILADIRKKDKPAIDKILKKYKIIEHTEAASGIRKNSISCVALPTCPLALAEAQRYLPDLIGKIEPLLAGHGLGEENIIIRMTGCPNGCGRPYAAEIGFVGTAPGRYNLHLGGDHEGTRLNRIYKENLDEAAILKELDLLFWLYRKERITGEKFGDFALRQRWYKP